MKPQRKLDGDPAPGPAQVKLLHRRERLISPAQLAVILNISRRQAHYLIAQGHFRVVPVGKRMLRIFESSIDDYLTRQADLFAFENGLQ